MDRQSNIGSKEAVKEAVKNTGNPLYWLKVAVKQGELSEAQAGYIIKTEGY